jgi:hypothetical protein
MSREDHAPFKVTWPRADDGRTALDDDLDLKRPGKVDARTREVVLLGALAGPAARPNAGGRRRDGA